jgi:hypothetical protein
MRVQITPTATKSDGTTATAKGIEPVWRVKFAVDSDRSLSFETTVTVIGPTSNVQARQEALGLFRQFMHAVAGAADTCNP